MTSHPNDMSNDLINCYKDCKKLMPFLHLPIQSGSDRILKLMNRKHDKKYYLSVIEKLKSINKDIKFSSDFIIGYPEETEKDFQETIKLIEKVGFFNSYSFIFSSRPGTPAAKKQLNNLEESKKRLKEVQDIIANFQMKNNKKHFQQYCEVLIENKIEGPDQYFGRTQFMTPVKFQSNNCKPGELVNVKITSFNQGGLFGVHHSNKVRAA
jgi:tRNA-2-methylthio-N6-dimethylallyladenosine synthase